MAGKRRHPDTPFARGTPFRRRSALRRMRPLRRARHVGRQTHGQAPQGRRYRPAGAGRKLPAHDGRLPPLRRQEFLHGPDIPNRTQPGKTPAALLRQRLERFTFEKGKNSRRQHSAARKRKNISAPQKEQCPAVSIIMTCRRGTTMRALSRAFPFPVILLNKARWGRGGGQGEGYPLSREQRGGPSP